MEVTSRDIKDKSLGYMNKYISLIGGDTCINPDVHTTRMPNIPWRKMGDGWFSNLRGGFQVNHRDITAFGF